MFIIKIVFILTDDYNRPPQKSKVCTMTWPIVKITVKITVIAIQKWVALKFDCVTYDFCCDSGVVLLI